MENVRKMGGIGKNLLVGFLDGLESEIWVVLEGVKLDFGGFIHIGKVFGCKFKCLKFKLSHSILPYKF